ncbi:hypothetical protein [Sodalis sp.]|uniref:hypothetical protein n=1 Tax=Sodalis sp. (in: enterobacteria) TaxID=1898979 RepID=UPI003872DB78
MFVSRQEKINDNAIVLSWHHRHSIPLMAVMRLLSPLYPTHGGDEVIDGGIKL